MPTPARFTSGISTVAKEKPLGDFGLPDWTRWNIFLDDFIKFNAITGATTVDPTGVADWSLMRTFTGTPTALITGEEGGILVLTNGTADNDNSVVRWKGQNATTVKAETFRLALGKKFFMKTRLKLSDATDSDFVVGLQIDAATAILTTTDGIYFSKVDGSAVVSAEVTKNSAITATVAGTMVNDTYANLALYYDGVSATKVFFNDVHVGTSLMTNLPDDEDLEVTFSVQNGSAAARSMSIDYIFCANQRF